MSANSNTLQWRHNDHDGVSNHQPHDCLLSRLFIRRSKKTSKLRVTGLCAGNSPGTGEFPARMANNAENVSIWWRHHDHVQFNTWCGVMSPTNLFKDDEIFQLLSSVFSTFDFLTFLLGTVNKPHLFHLDAHARNIVRNHPWNLC